MPLTLLREDLPALSRGFAMLGSGGGGSPHLTSLILDTSGTWPIVVHDVADLDPATSCVAVGYAGATLLLEERLPDDAPFAPAITAIERWLGVESSVVCMLEGAGINGLASLQLAGGRDLVDVDCMGRALPDLDQTSLLVEGRPGIVAATPTGAQGVALVHDARPQDVERVIRTGIECNGGWAGIALGGFTVGDLVPHAMPGALARALSLGRALLGALHEHPGDLAAAVGGELLGVGRVVKTRSEPGATGLVSFELRGTGGDVLRLVARSELIALVRNGVVIASTPTIVVALDSTTRTPLEVDEIAVGKDLIVLSLPAHPWWRADPRRRVQASPAKWGIDGLEETG